MISKTILQATTRLALVVLGAGMLSLSASAAGEMLPGSAHAAVTQLALADMQVDPFNTEGQLRSGIAAYNQGNYAEAFRKFRNISTLGVPEAEYRLGMMYAEGRGVRQNLRQAAYWLNQAAQQKFPGARDALASIRPDAS